MKRLFLKALALLISGVLTTANAQVRVEGYYKRNGTYVKPHYRSRPDGNRFNNWSVKPNINPYTGTRGTKNPYSSGLGSSLGSGLGSSLGGPTNPYRNQLYGMPLSPRSGGLLSPRNFNQPSPYWIK